MTSTSVTIRLWSAWLASFTPPTAHQRFAADTDGVVVRLARIVHAADISEDLPTDPLGPGLLAIGIGGLEVEADDHRLLDKGSFVYDALYAWCRLESQQ